MNPRQGRPAPKTVKPSEKGQAIEILVGEPHLPDRTACRAVGLSRTAYYRAPVDWLSRDSEVIAALRAMVPDRNSQPTYHGET